MKQVHEHDLDENMQLIEKNEGLESALNYQRQDHDLAISLLEA
jgi:hypothetical protein